MCFPVLASLHGEVAPGIPLPAKSHLTLETQGQRFLCKHSGGSAASKCLPFALHSGIPHSSFPILFTNAPQSPQAEDPGAVLGPCWAQAALGPLRTGLLGEQYLPAHSGARPSADEAFVWRHDARHLWLQVSAAHQQLSPGEPMGLSKESRCLHGSWLWGGPLL